MASSGSRRGGFTAQALNPHDPAGAPLDVLIPLDLVRRWFKTSQVDFENLRLVVPEVLERPAAVFGGVRDYEEGGYCYVGWPDEWYVRPGCIVPFLKRRLVLAVYVNPALRLYEMQAEKIEHEGSFRPQGWRDRYEALLWARDD